MVAPGSIPECPDSRNTPRTGCLGSGKVHGRESPQGVNRQRRPFAERCEGWPPEALGSPMGRRSPYRTHDGEIQIQLLGTLQIPGTVAGGAAPLRRSDRPQGKFVDLPCLELQAAAEIPRQCHLPAAKQQPRALLAGAGGQLSGDLVLARRIIQAQPDQRIASQQCRTHARELGFTKVGRRDANQGRQPQRLNGRPVGWRHGLASHVPGVLPAKLLALARIRLPAPARHMAHFQRQGARADRPGDASQRRARLDIDTQLLVQFSHQSTRGIFPGFALAAGELPSASPILGRRATRQQHASIRIHQHTGHDFDGLRRTRQALRRR